MTVSAVAGTELLDRPDADPVLVARALREIARANRWFGGVRALHAGLAALLPPGDRPEACSLLDVGTGAGDLPLAARRWGARRGIVFTVVGADPHPAATVLAATAGVPSLRASGHALPFGDAHVDIVLLSQLVHHLDDVAAVAMLREAHRVAARGVIIADLHPTPLAALAFRVGGLFLGFHRVTITDGVTSLRRARRADALLALARRAGAAQPVAARSRFARLTVTWRTDR